MPDFNPQEDLKSAFQQWKKKWEKMYASTEEEDAGFKNFSENLRQQPDILSSEPSEPLWNVLNNYADRHRTENFEILRLDYFVLDDDDEDDDLPDAPLVFGADIKQEDGTTCFKYLTLEDYVKYEEDQDAIVKHQSTVLPVKRSTDDKDDTKEEDQDGTVKHPKNRLGGGGSKNQDVAVTVDNEES